LNTIFLLGQRSTEGAAPFVKELLAQENLLSLVVNSYATGLLSTEMRAREFELLGRLVASVPIWSLRPHADPSRIGPLCDLIQSTVRATQPYARQFQAGI
jgi:hypothetical protein